MMQSSPTGKPVTRYIVAKLLPSPSVRHPTSFSHRLGRARRFVPQNFFRCMCLVDADFSLAQTGQGSNTGRRLSALSAFARADGGR
jgi:hypothetical protein